MHQFNMLKKDGVDEADGIRRQIWELDKEWELNDLDEVVDPDEDNNEGWVNEMDELTLESWTSKKI